MKRLVIVLSVMASLAVGFAGGSFYQGQLTPPRVVTKYVHDSTAQSAPQSKPKTKVVYRTRTVYKDAPVTTEAPVQGRDANGNLRNMTNAQATKSLSDAQDEINKLSSELGADEDKMYKAGLIGNNAYDEPQGNQGE